MKIDKVLNRADERVRLMIDLNNKDNDLQKKLGWGQFIVYLFLHTEGYCEKLVTFEKEDEAQSYLDYLLSSYCVDDDEATWDDEVQIDIDEGYLITEESEAFKLKAFEDFDSSSSWDLPIRKGQNKTWGYSVGYAEASDFVECLPEDKAKYFLESFFWSNLIPGYTRISHPLHF